MIIKYRCWDDTKKEWRKPNPDDMVGIFVVDEDAMRVVPPIGYEFLLWTGFSDKNDKDIYPGDILNDTYYVWWDVLRGAWGLYNKKRGAGSLQRFDYYKPENAEITGNIYENPEWFEETT